MKKLKIWYAFLILGIMVVMSVSCNKDEELALDFEITVPDNWSYYILANEGLVYSAMRDAESSEDSLREYLLIYKEPLPGYNLQLYYSQRKGAIMNSEFYVSTVQDDDTVYNGNPCKRFIYQEAGKFINQFQDTFDVALITSDYMFFKDDNGYFFNFISVDTIFYRNGPLFNDIMSTFQFKN